MPSESTRRLSLETTEPEIQVIGFDPPENMHSIFNSDDLIKFLKSRIPQDFLDGINKISFQEPEQSKSEDAWFVDGRIITRFNSLGRILLVEIVIYAFPYMSEKPTPLHQFLLSRVIFHEIGHYVHSVLRFEELQKWTEAVNKHRIDLTLM